MLAIRNWVCSARMAIRLKNYAMSALESIVGAHAQRREFSCSFNVEPVKRALLHVTVEM